MLKSKRAKRPPPNLSLHTSPVHVINGDPEKYPQLRPPGSNDDGEVLTLGSDDELDLSNTSTSLDDDFQALHVLRESVKKNLRLRPIKSSSNLRHHPDPIPPPPLSSASDYFTPLSPTAPKQAHPIHPSSLASRLSGNSSWVGQEIAGTGRQSLPLLIDTRPPATHIQSHIRDSINIAIPSLILKRIAKSNNPTATLPTLHSLRQFISTESGKATWDSYLASYPSPDSPTSPLWDGDIIVYDDDIRSHPKDASFKASSLVAFTLLPLLQHLLPPGGSVDYLYGSIAHPALYSFVVGKPTETGVTFKSHSNTLQVHSSTNDAITPGPGSGLFNLDTQLAYKSRHTKAQAYQIEISSATSEHPSSPLPKSPAPLSLQPPKSPLPAPLSIPSASKFFSLSQPSKSPRPFNPPKSPSPLTIPPTSSSVHANASSNTPSPPPSFLHPPLRRPSIPTLRTNTTSLEKLPKLSTSFPSLSLRNRAASSVVPSTQPSIALAISTAALEEKKKNGTSRTAPTSPVTHLTRTAPPLPSLAPAIHKATMYRHTQQNSITSPIYSAYYTPPHTPSQVFPSYADAFSNIPLDAPISEEQSHLSVTPKAGRSPTTATGSGEWPPVPPPPLPSLSAAVSGSSHWTINNGKSYDSVTSPDYDEPPRMSFNTTFERSFADSPPPTTTSTASEDEGEVLPGFVVSTILPGFLYLGPAPSTPSHLVTLQDLGVKRVLNMAIECNEDDYGLALGSVFEKYTKIPLRDIVEEDAVPRVVREVCEVLDAARLHSSPTYVHCKAGKSRSVTAVIAYLIHSHHWTLGRAYRFVCERRKGISPNIGFVSELMAFEEEELGGKSVGVVHHPSHGHNLAHHGHQPVNRMRKQSNANLNGESGHSGPGHGASQSISGPIMYSHSASAATTSTASSSASTSSSTSGSSIGTESSPSSSSSTLPSDYDDTDSDPPSSSSTPDARLTVHSGVRKAGLPVINTAFANSDSSSSTENKPYQPSSTTYHPHQIPLSAQEPPSYAHSHEHKTDLGSGMGSGSMTPLSSNNPSHDPFQELEIRDSSGRYRHARRAPVDEMTLQPMRRVSKAGLESWGWKDSDDE
ncbi:hypothetical protein L218DRAFT_1079330 [Marasmius fiardii PR-910]|nr:hypothetical protein L218DRAFT_1079330 [Marasmius fiardii PR-910]